MPKGMILVVGCTGFVGSHVVKALLQQGFSVRGACRSPEQARKTFADSWICRSDQFLELVELTLPVDGSPVAEDVIEKCLENVVGVCMCAGHEKQEPTTIDFMVNAAISILTAAKKATNKITVVLTSSTGSTNPPTADPGALKNEIDFWSEPSFQQSSGKYSPAAKTLMEIKSLEFVGRNQKNQIVDKEVADSSPRLCIINPSLILGPRLQPGELQGNGLPWFAKIVRGEAMNKEIPNDSMSIISVTDLAMLHVACFEDPAASGRYFGVVQSWPWEEILTAIKRQVPQYRVPPKNFTEIKPITQFDKTRRDSLLLAAFGDEFNLKTLEEILKETIDYLRSSGNL